MKFYHASDHADAILLEGFRDGGGTYMTGQWWEGVWLSDRRLGGGEGGLSGFEPLLEIHIPDEVIAEYEWINEPPMGYREWLVPAEIINRYGPPRLVNEDEEEAGPP